MTPGMQCWLERAEKFARETPDSRAVTARGESLTYRQFVCRAREFARTLSTRVQAGGYVVCRAAARLEYVVAYAATLYCGGVFVPLEADCPAVRLHETAAAVRASAVIGRPDDRVTGAAFYETEALRSFCGREEAELPPFRADSAAQLLFTSGSSGRAKGVLSDNRMLLQGESIARQLGYGRQTSCYLFAQVNHAAFFMIAVAVLAGGGEVILSQGLTAVADFEDALAHGANAVHATPSVMNFLLARCGDLLDTYREKIEIVTLAGEMCPLHTQLRLCGALPQTKMYVLYGSTETAHLTQHRFSGGAAEERCVGSPSDGVEIDLLPCVQGYRVACRTPFAAVRLLGGEPFAGRVITGDIGHMRAGKLYIDGRADDVILSGGQKIDPHEVEAAAAGYAGVEECVCVSVPDKLLGRSLRLLVRFGSEADAAGLKRYLTERLEHYKVPRRIEAVGHIRRTSNGKADRRFYSEEDEQDE